MRSQGELIWNNTIFTECHLISHRFRFAPANQSYSLFPGIRLNPETVYHFQSTLLYSLYQACCFSHVSRPALLMISRAQPLTFLIQLSMSRYSNPILMRKRLGLDLICFTFFIAAGSKTAKPVVSFNAFSTSFTGSISFS